MRAILVTGGTGFIGRSLTRSLVNRDYTVTVLTRNASQVEGLDRVTFIQSLDQLADDATIDVIINLAGEPLAASRWNDQRKRDFLDSRVSITQAIGQLVERLDRKPNVLLSGSAIGWYGPHKDEPLNESSQAVGCFSHDLCAAWEAEAKKMQQSGLRICLLRIGVVLGSEGGPLKELSRSHRLGVNAVFGDGSQYISWIHIDDMIGLITYLIVHDDLEGVVNCTAPNPVAQRDFARTIAEYLQTWIMIMIPGWLLRLMVGEMADEVVITGQRVLPAKALAAGYSYKYSDLKEALGDLLG